jgi:hypothetical protein
MRRMVAFALMLSWLGLTGCIPSSPTQASLETILPERWDTAQFTFPRMTAEPDAQPACPGEDRDLVMDLGVLPVPDLAEPAPRVPFRDPAFGTCLVRVTDRASDLPADDPSQGMKNEYSRVQSFNADGSLILVRSIEARWYVYDASSLLPLAEVPASVEPRWDAQDPAGLYTIDETRLLRLDLSRGEQRLVHDFAADFPGETLATVWTRYEGSPSADGRTWGLIAQDSDWRPVALLVYDLAGDQVLATRRLDANSSIDSVTISPRGNYLLVYHDEVCREGTLGDADHPCGLMVYDQSLRTCRGLLPIIGHSDTALDANGHEVLVFQDIQHDQISMLDLPSGQVTPLLTIDFSHSPLGFHFSGRAFQRPGWIVVSTHSGAQPSATWMDDQVFVLELVPGGRVIRLGHTHSVVNEQEEHDYWAEPHASTNPDLTRILFTSNWGRSGSAAVDMYQIILPAGWLGSAP